MVVECSDRQCCGCGVFGQTMLLWSVGTDSKCCGCMMGQTVSVVVVECCGCGVL